MRTTARVLTLLVGMSFLGVPACAEKKAEPKTTGHQQKCNAQDVKIAVHAKSKEFVAVTDKCATKHLGGAEGTGECIQEAYPKLSRSCVACFGDMAECTRKNCAGKCMADHGCESCLDCAKAKCQEPQGKGEFSLQTCTGLKGNQLPGG